MFRFLNLIMIGLVLSPSTEARKHRKGSMDEDVVIMFKNSEPDEHDDENESDDSEPRDSNFKGYYDCDDGWDYFRGYCYRWMDDRVTYEEAMDRCEDEDSNLVSIHSWDENDFTLEFGNDFWIGLNDMSHEDVFEWTDDTRLNYERWFPDQPNNKGARSHCVHSHNYYSKHGGWNDFDCNNRRPFICKYYP